MTTDPRWLSFARRYIGQKEVPGKQNNPWIVSIWKYLGLPYHDDETAWCKAFASYCLQHCDIATPPGASARSMQSWGVKLDKPVPGCIVVFWRGSPKSYLGHVGFVTRVTADGHLIVLGGNQRDQVCEEAFSKDRVVSYRWPAGEPLPGEVALPVDDKPWTVSTNEA